jgi:hypothetical protein
MGVGRVIAVEGASAAGKTTAVARAAARVGAAVVPEAYRRLEPPPSLEFATEEELVRLEETLLAEDARRFAEARRLARAGRTVLADTGFLGPLTYTAGLVELRVASPRTLRDLIGRARALAARRAWGPGDGTVYLATSPHAQYARARADPSGHPARLVARHMAVGAIERRLYRERFAPLAGRRFREVSGDGARATVADRLATAVRSVAAADGRAPSPARVLAALGGTGAPVRRGRGNR